MNIMAENASNTPNELPIHSHAQKIKEEVNKLLPDINFDDDDDEEDESNVPVEIFTRGKYISDLELCDFEEEEESVEELAPPLTEALNSYDFPTFEQGDGALPALAEAREEGNSVMELMQRAVRELGGTTIDEKDKNEDGMKIKNTTSGNEHERSQARRLPSTSRHVLFGGLNADQHEEARSKYLADKTVTLKFGTRGDIDLDELLRNVPSPNVDVSHYYDVEIEEEEENNPKSALIQKLEEMSERYAASASRWDPPQNSRSSSTDTNPSRSSEVPHVSVPSSTTQRPLNGHKVSSSGPGRAEFCGSTQDSGTVIDFVPSSRQGQQNPRTCNAGTSTSGFAGLMEPAGNFRATVHLDLRPAPPVAPEVPAVVSSSESSSEEEEDEEGGGGLWLDRHRRARALENNVQKPKQAWTENSGCEVAETTNRESTASAENVSVAVPASTQSANKLGTTIQLATATKTATSATVTSSATTGTGTSTGDDATSTTDAPESTSVSERVQRKIAEIKRKEAELSQRRLLGHQLEELLPKEAVNENRPLIFHEDESFQEPIPVLPENEALPIVTLRFVQRAPGELQTLGKRPRPIDDGRAVSGSHAALLAWLLNLTAAGSAPFRVLGLEQSGSTRSGHLMTHVAVQFSCPTIRNVAQLKSFLGANSLPQLCSWAPEQLSLSSLPLSKFLSLVEDFEWRRTSGHFGWFLLRTDERLAGWDACSQPNVQTSALCLESELLTCPARVLRLLTRTQRSGLDLSGVRLFHPDASPFLALAVRGPSAVATLCAICGPGPGAELRGCPVGSWRCPRFPEAVPKLLARWFGARVPAGADASSLRRASWLRHCLAVSEASDLLLLASPALPEASWLLRAAIEAGMEAVGARRVRLVKEKAREVLGMSEAQASVFSGGTCHLLVLRRENAMGHAASFVEQAFAQLREGQQEKENMPHSSLLFYVMPCLPALLDCLGGSNLAQLPPTSTSVGVTSDESGTSSEELSSFVLTHGPDCRQLMLEVLDQTSGHELLALKLIPRVPAGHTGLISDCLGARLNSTTAICCILLRGLQLQDSVMPAVRYSNGRIHVTKNLKAALRLANAFFYEREVHGDPRRRHLHPFLPATFLQNEPSPLVGMGQLLPDISVPFSVTFQPQTDRLWIARRIWKSLESENFRIQHASLESPTSLSFVVSRSNGLYRIANNLRTYLAHLLPSAQLQVASTAADLPTVVPEPPQLRSLPASAPSAAPESEMAELALLIITAEGLGVQFRGRPSVHLLLELLSSKKFHLLALRMVDLQGEAAQEVKLSGMSQARQTQTSKPYLCLLLFGLMARLGMRQLLQSNANVSKMANHIFVPHSKDETMRIASGLFSFVAADSGLSVE